MDLKKQNKIKDAKSQLMMAGIDFKTFNKDVHFKIYDEYSVVMDFWPTTGKTILTSGRSFMTLIKRRSIL